MLGGTEPAVGIPISAHQQPTFVKHNALLLTESRTDTRVS